MQSSLSSELEYFLLVVKLHTKWGLHLIVIRGMVSRTHLETRTLSMNRGRPRLSFIEHLRGELKYLKCWLMSLTNGIGREGICGDSFSPWQWFMHIYEEAFLAKIACKMIFFIQHQGDHAQTFSDRSSFLPCIRRQMLYRLWRVEHQETFRGLFEIYHSFFSKIYFQFECGDRSPKGECATFTTAVKKKQCCGYEDICHKIYK